MTPRNTVPKTAFNLPTFYLLQNVDYNQRSDKNIEAGNALTISRNY